MRISFAVEGVDDGDGVQTAFVERVRSERIRDRVEKTSACNDQLVVGRRTDIHYHHVLVSVDLSPQTTIARHCAVIKCKYRFIHRWRMCETS